MLEKCLVWRKEFKADIVVEENLGFKELEGVVTYMHGYDRVWHHVCYNACLFFIGKDEIGRCREIIEVPEHPCYIDVQFHLELKSRLGNPSTLFLGLIVAACRQLDAVLQGFESQEKIVTKGIDYEARQFYFISFLLLVCQAEKGKIGFSLASSSTISYSCIVDDRIESIVFL